MEQRDLYLKHFPSLLLLFVTYYNEDRFNVIKYTGGSWRGMNLSSVLIGK